MPGGGAWRSAAKALVFGFGLVTCALALYLTYLYATYIDEVITVGSAYGFRIGQAEQDVFETIVAQSRAKKVDGLHIAEPFQTFESSWNGTLDMVQHSNRWTLFPGRRDDFFDTIDLTFEDAALVRIHRHRQRFELP